MDVIYSKTGSDGNASVISDGKTKIQIDAGIAPMKVNKNALYRLHEVSGLLCSHSHLDHSRYIHDYINFGTHVYVNEDTLSKLKLLERWVNIYDENILIRIGTFIIKPFLVPHTNSDGTDCPNYGFLICSTYTREKMLWATDCSYIEQKFPALDYICIECSYLDVDNYADELEYINQFVEKRRLNSHMSLNRCIEFLSNQDLSKCKEVRLLHLTKSQGNIKDIILDKIQKKFEGIKFVI